jgi:hypothetical protein
VSVERELEALRRDVARFDRRARLCALAGAAAAVLLALFCAGVRQAQSQSASLAVRAVVLIDASNRQRIVLGSDNAGRPGIWLRDESGKDRMYFGFGAQPATPQFSLGDETGRPRLAVAFGMERGDPQVTLADGTGTTRAYLGFGVQLRTPQFVLNDERGKDRLYAGWTRDGTPLLEISDDSGNAVWKSGTPGPGTGTGRSGTGTTRKSAP